MLKRRFYDILTIIFILLIIFLMGFQYSLVKKDFLENADKKAEKFSECTGQGLNAEELIECLNTTNDKEKSLAIILNAIIYILGAIYWIFILALAIKLHKKEFTKLVDVIVIAILVPLAFLFYLVNLRGSLKKYERQNLTQPQKKF